MTRGAVGWARGEVVADRRLGAYRQVSVALAGSVAARPGQFVVLPPRDAGLVLPRSRWLAGADSEPGFGTTLEVVVHGDEPMPPVGEEASLLGPLGRGFSAPTDPVPVVVVAHEIAGATARWWATRLRGRGCRVHLVLVAAEPDLQVDVVAAGRTADSLVLVRPDAAAAAVSSLLDGGDARVLYAVTPVPLSRELASVAGSCGVPAQVTLFDVGRPDRCGTGLCGACDLDLAGEPSRTVRPCADGPVLPGRLLSAGGSG